MTIIAVDPGKTTGLAWTLDHHVSSPVAQQADVEHFYEWIGRAPVTLPVTFVVERFDVGAGTIRKSRGEYWSLKLIGLIEFICWKNGYELVMQQAVAAKRLITDERLKLLGWWVPGQDHARDALRHLALYLVHHELLELPE